MAHEILSVKLCELDEKLFRMRSRIQLMESAGQSRLLQEIALLRKECGETAWKLQKNLKDSRARSLKTLSAAYERMEAIVQETRKACEDEFLPEDQILMAEYALDFALQAADQALLLSMEAIHAQTGQRDKERRMQ